MSALKPYPEIAQLIPHQPPMRLIESIIRCTNDQLTARAAVAEGCPFWTPQGVPSCIGLEYLGQAAAAFFSIIAFKTLDQNETLAPPAPGMLIASRSYECSAGFFPPACELLIEVKPSSAVNASGLVKFAGRIELAESAQTFAKGDLSVYLPPA